MTVVRQIIDILVTPISPVGVAVQAVSFGIGLLEQDAFAAAVAPEAGVAADQTPRGWLWRHRCTPMDSTNVQGMIPDRVRGDFHGQRVIGDGELVIITNSDNAFGSAFNVQVIGSIRCLFKL